MNEQDKIKEIIKSEYVKCANDPVYFFKKYCFISHPKRGRIKFQLYPFQEKTLGCFRQHRYTIINKSRQLGISTLVAGYALWLMLFHKDKTVLCIATKQETAKGMVEKVQFMYNNLPLWIRGKDKPLSDNKLSLKLRNNSQIVATSAASDAGRSYAVSLLVVDEAAFIEGIDKIYTSIKPTIATGGEIIALSSPNGIGNWFHRMYTEAISGDNDFFPIELKWSVHPERDEQWEARERANMSSREFAQEYDCDFLGSGNSVVENDVLTFYNETYIEDPIEKRYLGGDLWIWNYADTTKSYILTADVARGDGSDYSTFHVIETENCEQVAEYKSKISTREFAHLLVAVGTEYNNALLVVDNSNIGWDVISSIVEMNYPNLYYSPKSYGEMNLDKWMYKMETEQTVPGFTLSNKTRPLVIMKMESYIRERVLILKSKRTLEELRVFIWLNGKAQAQSGYNDDLVLPLGTGLFVRDTALKFYRQGMDLTRAAISGISRANNDVPVYNTNNSTFNNPYIINTGHGGEDISWVL